ncbi:MAG: FAD-dependent oxidoreductase [Burkholderiales bacterium]
MSENATNAVIQAQRAWQATLMGTIADAFRILERSIGPLLDLLIRVWLAQAFFVSGVLKISNWDNALYLSQYEYPVSWMDPVTAAYVGVAIELIGPVLLAVGLATRFAAVSMLILALVIQYNYVALDVHLFWVVLFGWFSVHGAGALSLDNALRRGLADTALPFAVGLMRLTQWVTRFIAPLYQFAVRALFGGSILAVAAYGVMGMQAALPGAITLLLPLQSAAHFITPLELGCAALLVVGLATRFATLALIGLALALQMVDPRYSQLGYWLMALSLFTAYGAGTWSLDTLVNARLRRIFPQLDGRPAFSLDGLPRVVIVGGGFGGLTCAARLRLAPVQITLIDRHNYHLFQPLLYQVATAALSPGDVSTPVRGLFREYFNTQVLLGEVTGVDTERQEVLIGKKQVPYDYLVLASGASHSYFGRDDWAPYAPGLKRIEDATEVRRRILLAFEQAEATDDVEERQKLLNFLIVGAGPTGVELAGAIAELARFGMEKDFRRFDPATARVILVQSGPRILPAFPERLSEVAKTSLEKLGVEVFVNSRVEQIDDDGVKVSGTRIASRTVLWAAGVVASPAAKWVGGETDNAGRLKVGADLSVPGLTGVFAIGDTALSNAWNDKPVPGIAPAAKQGGAYVAKLIRARVLGRPPPPPFTYKHLGSMATIGRKAAVADFGFIRLSGTPAWWLWGLVHVLFLVGLRNRISVMLDWFWCYLTFRTGIRLITGDYGDTRASASTVQADTATPAKRVA